MKKMSVKLIRKVRIEGDVAYVPLTKGYEAIIDAVDVCLVEHFNWCSTVGGWTSYARRSWIDSNSGRHGSTSMHRALLSPPLGVCVDHINRNGLDNRRSNIRLATTSQNACNVRLRADNISGAKGVHWYASKKVWRAKIMLDGVLKHLGNFKDFDAATAAYAKANSEIHGEYGRLR